MDLTNVAIFGTRHIQIEQPLFEGQEAAYSEFYRGQPLAWFSTGKLEEALGRRYDVHVCSIRPAFGPHDRWWRELVDESRVFNACRVMAAAMTGNPMDAVHEPWVRLFERLGIEWPHGLIRGFDGPALWLVSRYGVKDGSCFTGHRLLC